MNIRTICLFVLIAVSSILAKPVSADIIIVVDASPETDGIQSQRTLRPSETFQVAVRMQLSETDSLAGYAFRVRFDADELTLLDKTQFPPDGYVANDDDNNREGNDDSRLGLGTPYQETQVGAVDLSFTAEPVRGEALVDVAMLTFQAGTPVNDGLDITTLFHPVFDGMFDADFNVVPERSITFGSASFRAVPEPRIWMWLGMVSLGAVAARRRV